ncbi:MAG: hypothetical protein K2N81_12405 [Acetatifactor sp.]|nr:hypothetical protein [Acetatifactor sp.]
MSGEDKRRDGAMRLFGALSGVDEEYLAACEKDCESRGAASSRIRVFAQKYGKIAAVLGIAVLGLGLVGLQSANSSISPKKFMLMDGEQLRNESNSMSGGAAPQDMAEAMDDVGEGIAAESSERVTGQQDPNFMPEQNAASQLQNGQSDNLASPKQDNTDSMDKYKTDGTSSEAPLLNDAVITLASARETAVVGNYLPSVLPKEGEIFWVTGENLTGQERVTLCWTYPDGKGSFLWTVWNLGEKEADRTEKLPAGQSVLEGADMTRDDMETQIADALQPDGGITDGILCICYRSDGNYILVEFQGTCDADTLWAMLGSVG